MILQGKSHGVRQVVGVLGVLLTLLVGVPPCAPSSTAPTEETDTTTTKPNSNSDGLDLDMADVYILTAMGTLVLLLLMLFILALCYIFRESMCLGCCRTSNNKVDTAGSQDNGVPKGNRTVRVTMVKDESAQVDMDTVRVYDETDNKYRTYPYSSNNGNAMSSKSGPAAVPVWKSQQPWVPHTRPARDDGSQPHRASK